MSMEPLPKVLSVLNGKERLMAGGCESLPVQSMLGIEDLPVIGIKVKPGDHEDNKGGKERFKKLRRLLLVLLVKDNNFVKKSNDNVVSLLPWLTSGHFLVSVAGRIG